jgi:hypothetical protein
MPEQPPAPDQNMNASSLMTEGMSEIANADDDPVEQPDTEMTVPDTANESCDLQVHFDNMSDQAIIEKVVDEWERRGNDLDELHEQLNDNLLYKRVVNESDNKSPEPKDRARQQLEDMMI